jgi:hypothetical protein
MERVASGGKGKQVVEAVFRALTSVNAEGSATRRPLAFQKLCAETGADRGELLRILDVFRAPDATFLTPYAPATIEDKTIVDVSHEALIRCWDKIGGKPGGWLQKEIREGLGWRVLLFQAESFTSVQASFLAEPATEWAEALLGDRSEAWADRYGGGRPKVEALIAASREHWRQEAEKEEAGRRREIEAERFRRHAAELQAERQAEQSELRAKRSAQSRMQNFTLFGVAALISAAALAIWSAQLNWPTGVALVLVGAAIIVGVFSLSQTTWPDAS